MNELKVLFVCGRNRRRSPTAERIYRNDPRIQARAAGVSSKSPHQISRADIAWADVILAFEEEYGAWIRSNFRGPGLPPIKSLDIPDEYGFMEEELIELIRSHVELVIDPTLPD